MTHEFSRREFLIRAGQITIGASAVLALSNFLDSINVNAAGTSSMSQPRIVDTKYYRILPESVLECYVCHFRCRLKPGEKGICRSRKNTAGKLYTHAYGNPCIIQIDPIEKLPMSHFLPTTQTLSLAIGGCNARCLYCQNWQESQSAPEDLKNYELPPENAAGSAKTKSCPSIAFTYTEPSTYHEYMLDIAKSAKSSGIKTICASNMYFNHDILRELCGFIDGFAVALKGFDEGVYSTLVGIQLKNVLKSLEILKEKNTHIEIVNLVVPSYTDDLVKIKDMCRWIYSNLGSDVPLHFGRFVPQHKLKNLTRTPVQTLEAAHKIALDSGIKYAYIFNLSPHPANDTYCEKCKKTLIKRLGFKTLENNISAGKCKFCGQKIPGVWLL